MSDLRRLPQKDAALLLGTSARNLRDDGSVPRSADGTYDAVALVEWARGRSTEPAEIPDRDFEDIALLAGFFELPSEGQYGAAVAKFDRLRQKHGDGALVAFVDEVLGRWRHTAEWLEEYEADPKSRQRNAAAERQRAEEAAARDSLRITVVCEGCERVRNGRKWIDGKVPKNHATAPGRCPACFDRTDI